MQTKEETDRKRAVKEGRAEERARRAEAKERVATAKERRRKAGLERGLGDG